MVLLFVVFSTGVSATLPLPFRYPWISAAPTQHLNNRTFPQTAINGELPLSQVLGLHPYIHLLFSCLRLLFGGSTSAMGQVEVLQGASERVVLCEEQNVLVNTDGVEHAQIRAHRHGGITFLHPDNGRLRTACPFGNLLDGKVTPQSGATDLFADGC